MYIDMYMKSCMCEWWFSVIFLVIIFLLHYIQQDELCEGMEERTSVPQKKCQVMMVMAGAESNEGIDLHLAVNCLTFQPKPSTPNPSPAHA